jgi:hypothetical protein
MFNILHVLQPVLTFGFLSLFLSLSRFAFELSDLLACIIPAIFTRYHQLLYITASRFKLHRFYICEPHLS